MISKQRPLIAGLAMTLALALAVCDTTSAPPTSTPVPAALPTQRSPPATATVVIVAPPDNAPAAPPAFNPPIKTGAPAPPTETSLPTPPTLPSTSTADIPPTAAPVRGGGGEGEGEEGGVEEALVTYRDAAQHFSIGYPGSWTRDATVAAGVKFDGGDGSMRLDFITLPQGTTVMAYAQQDIAAVAAAFLGFKQVGLAPSTEVAKAVVLGFEAQGTSTVTGKAYAARGDRYYILLSNDRLAVLTVVGPQSHYDREGVRDIALTLKVVK